MTGGEISSPTPLPLHEIFDHPFVEDEGNSPQRSLCVAVSCNVITAWTVQFIIYWTCFGFEIKEELSSSKYASRPLLHQTEKQKQQQLQ